MKRPLGPWPITTPTCGAGDDRSRRVSAPGDMSGHSFWLPLPLCRGRHMAATRTGRVPQPIYSQYPPCPPPAPRQRPPGRRHRSSRPAARSARVHGWIARGPARRTASGSVNWCRACGRCPRPAFRKGELGRGICGRGLSTCALALASRSSFHPSMIHPSNHPTDRSAPCACGSPPLVTCWLRPDWSLRWRAVAPPLPQIARRGGGIRLDLASCSCM